MLSIVVYLQHLIDLSYAVKIIFTGLEPGNCFVVFWYGHSDYYKLVIIKFLLRSLLTRLQEMLETKLKETILIFTPIYISLCLIVNSIAEAKVDV